MRGNKPYYRRYIKELIDQDPVTITLHRRERTDDGYGGELITTTQMEPQVFRLYKKSSKYPMLAESGKIVSYGSQKVEKLLGLWDADIKKGDRFRIKDRTYQVIFVDRLQGISTEVELRVDADEYKE